EYQNSETLSTSTGVSDTYQSSGSSPASLAVAFSSCPSPVEYPLCSAHGTTGISETGNPSASRLSDIALTLSGVTSISLRSPVTLSTVYNVDPRVSTPGISMRFVNHATGGKSFINRLDRASVL